MIIRVEICVKELFLLGREFVWPRPNKCLRCNGRLWGHGFYDGYFDGFDQPLCLKRCRCPDCGCIFRLRPKDYWPRFQASIEKIRESLCSRFSLRRWLPDLSRSRQIHWLNGLLTQIKIHFGLCWSGELLEAFDRLSERGLAAVGGSVQSEGGFIMS